jgi:SAM-dependent methyltransferase
MNTFLSKSLTSFRRFIKSSGDLFSQLKPRQHWPGDVSRFDYQQAHNKFDIASTSTVLDIGSGGDPFPYATILTDRYIEPTFHRTDKLKLNGKPFVLSAIEKLPFRSKSMDFVFCAHVLEHVDDPIAACAEIVRVGKRGYIETPTLGKDMLFGWAKGMHKWHLMSISNKLIFFEYSERQLEGARSMAWSDVIFSSRFHPLQELFYNNQDLFNIMFNWQNGFECIVFYLDGRMIRQPLS